MAKFAVATQREFDTIIHEKDGITDQFDVMEDNIVELKGTSFTLDGSLPILESSYPIKFAGLGRNRTTITLANFPESWLMTEDDTEVEVPTWSPNFQTAFASVRFTATELTQITFSDREEFYEWKDVDYDRALIAPVIIADEVRATLSYLRENFVEGALEKGDHLVVARGVYTHHGIYVGEHRVIHYKNYWVQETSLEDFCHANTFWVYDHEERLSREETIARARSKIGDADYDLLTNNCEHFAWWCCTDAKWSHQVFAGTLLGNMANRGDAKLYRLRR